MNAPAIPDGYKRVGGRTLTRADGSFIEKHPEDGEPYWSYRYLGGGRHELAGKYATLDDALKALG